jgi:hypothetical protein
VTTPRSVPSPGATRRTYVIDTSVLLSDPWAATRFAEHDVVIPLVVIGIVLRQPLVAMLYRGGAYTAHDVKRTADVLGMLLLGLTPQIVTVPLATLFIVSGDTVFPMKVGIANFVLNAALDLVLRHPFGVAGLALSTSATLTVLAFVFAWEARRRWPAFGIAATSTPLVVSVCTGAAAAIIGVAALRLFDAHASRLGDAAVVALEDRFFGTNLDVADLTKWNGLPPMIHQSHIVQLSGIEAVCSGTSGDYLHRSNIFTELCHWRTRQKKLDLLGSLVGRKSDQL